MACRGRIDGQTILSGLRPQLMRRLRLTTQHLQQFGHVHVFRRQTATQHIIGSRAQFNGETGQVSVRLTGAEVQSFTRCQADQVENQWREHAHIAGIQLQQTIDRSAECVFSLHGVDAQMRQRLLTLLPGQPQPAGNKMLQFGLTAVPPQAFEAAGEAR